MTESFKRIPRATIQAIGYRDPEKSPFVVARQTAVMLNLAKDNLFGQPIIEYIHEYTLPQVLAARRTGSVFYQGYSAAEFDPEEVESAGLAIVGMAFMHRIDNPNFGPIHSRRGSLRAPKSLAEYQAMLDQTENVLKQLTHGNLNTNRLSMLGTPEYRTWAFYQTLGDLRLDLPMSSREAAQNYSANLNRLLEGLDIDF